MTLRHVTRPTVWAAVVLTLSACFAVTAPPASAHGGPIALSTLAAEATGPLQSVLRVEAAWASDGHGIDGLTLNVEGTGPGTMSGVLGARGSGVYEATLTYPEGGEWELTVSVVDGPPDVAWSATPLVLSQTVSQGPGPTTTTVDNRATTTTSPGSSTVPRASGPIVVEPRSVPRNSHSMLTFAVPNARRDTNLNRVALVFPAERPLLYATVRVVSGWTSTVTSAPLDPPIGNTTERVGSIEWTATDEGLSPGEFELFTFSIGPFPKEGRSIRIPTVQTYDSGEVVSWSEAPITGSGEPRYPAPIVRLGRTTSTSTSGGGHR
jgi:hypothetical protein